MVKENSGILHFSKLIKTWEKGKSPPSFEIKEFEKAELYVIRCLKQYLLITNPLRCAKTTQLVTSYIRPHNPVSVDQSLVGLRSF